MSEFLSERFMSPQSPEKLHGLHIIQMTVGTSMFEDFEYAFEHKVILEIYGWAFEVFGWFSPRHPRECKAVTIYLKRIGRPIRPDEPTCDFKKF